MAAKQQMLCLPEEGSSLLCYVTPFLYLHLHGAANHLPPLGGRPSDRTTAAGTPSLVSASHLMQATAWASSEVVVNIRRERGRWPPWGVSSEHLLSIWVAGAWGALTAVHL